MSALTRLSVRAVRGVQRQQAASRRGMAGGGPEPSYWAEGTQKEGHINGVLFNETPPPPGQSRVWEDWEAPWYVAFGTATVILYTYLTNQPNTNLTDWARVEAKRRMAEKEAA
mmetsp:Transcript_38761/g.96157  ORF Transcript_38761/g.96157 Transcript_38761/m.96157 type:complete len:113 (-) Transcript_38761:186-524(-)